MKGTCGRFLRSSAAVHVFHGGVEDGQAIELPQLGNVPAETMREYMVTKNLSFKLSLLSHFL